MFDRPVVLLLLTLAVLTLGLTWLPLMDWDEIIYAEAARQMYLTGDYLIPRINGQLFVEKPPLFFWFIASFYSLFGVGEFAPRFVSVLSGLGLMTILYKTGSRVRDSRFGTIWALVYASSLIPLMLSRMSLIDHFFNMWIALAVSMLFLYDASLRDESEGSGSKGGSSGYPYRSLAYLASASVAMGLAVLSKGPLGGVIPLVAYGSLKATRWKPAPRLAHFMGAGVLSLALASSWYLASYHLLGDEFLRGFARFQGQLFSKPLDGHSGPFLYHWFMMIPGFLPWSPLLLLWFRKSHRDLCLRGGSVRGMASLSLGWALFVLVLFSLVQTKLPHYSASMYIPLSFFASLSLYSFMERREPLPLLVRGVTLSLVIVLGGVLAVLPYFLAGIMEDSGYVMEPVPHVSPLAFLAGGVLVGGVAAAQYLFGRGDRIRSGILTAALSMGLFAAALWGLVLPLHVRYNQAPVLELMRKAGKGELALFRYLSFAPFFYGERKIHVLENYKFEGDLSLLVRNSEDLYVIAPTASHRELMFVRPDLVRVSEQGVLTLYRLPAAP